MPVYLARFGALGPVKIGHSKSVQTRLDAIQSRLWDDLHLFRLLEGNANDERALHKRFASLRIRFEWFHFSSEMTGDLGLHDLRADPTRTLTPHFHRNGGDSFRSAALRAWMMENGLYEHDVAALVGSTRSAVAGWLTYGHRPRAATTVRLIAASGGVLQEAYETPDPRWVPPHRRAKPKLIAVAA